MVALMPQASRSSRIQGSACAHLGPGLFGLLHLSLLDVKASSRRTRKPPATVRTAEAIQHDLYCLRDGPDVISTANWRQKCGRFAGVRIPEM